MNTAYLLAACATAALAFALTLFAADPQPATTSQPATSTKPAATLPAYVKAYLPLTYTNAAGKTLNYRLFVPEAAKVHNETPKLPLILFLHGSGGSGDNNTGQLTDGNPQAASRFVADDIQKKFPCFILAPQCPKKQTWGGIDFTDKKITPIDKTSEPLDLTLELLQKLLEDYPEIDANRLYITGLSLGGFGTWTAITHAPDTFAAAAPVCGGAPDSAFPILAKSKIPLWIFHGEKDPTVKVEFSRDAAKALKESNPDVKYTEYPNVGHNSWSKAYAEPDFLPWLFNQKRTPAK